MLVFEDEVAYPRWQLGALPCALELAKLFGFSRRRGGLGGLDGVGGGAEVMLGHMGHAGGLPGGVGGEPGRAA